MNKSIRILVSSLFLCFSSAYADIVRVSVSSSGEQGNDLSFFSGISTSSDGRYVAFSSEASNLVPGDTNGLTDVFVHDRQTGITERVSVSSSGQQGNDSSNNPAGSTLPSISANGRYVAFGSSANNLVPDDINGNFSDVFLHDRETGITELVSYDQNGEQRTYGSGRASISADGRFITYNTNQVYLYDRETNVTVRVSSSLTGQLGNRSSGNSKISADGRFIAFSSTASNLVSGDTNAWADIFVHNRETGITERISKSSSGEQGNNFSNSPSISADGRFVAFTSNASNLVANDTNNSTDTFLHDRQTDSTERVTVSSMGEQGNNIGSFSAKSSISADGRFIVFFSTATNLVPGGTGSLFVHDRLTGLKEVVSAGERPTISADGNFIAFESAADYLVQEDTNNTWDVFVTDNPLVESGNNLVTVEKLINNETREIQDSAAKLSTGTLYRQSYKVTNDSPDRIYQVRVFEDGNLACNFYALDPGQSRQRCDTFQTVLEGDQHVQVTVTGKVSGSGQAITSSTDAYYTGLTNATGELAVTHRINNINADTVDQAPTLGSKQANILFKVENTGNIELYQVKTYHDPVSPVNSGWDLQCVLGPMKPGQVRYCKKDITLSESGLNQAVGRVQGRNAIRSATEVINASNPTYFIVP